MFYYVHATERLSLLASPSPKTCVTSCNSRVFLAARARALAVVIVFCIPRFSIKRTPTKGNGVGGADGKRGGEQTKCKNKSFRVAEGFRRLLINRKSRFRIAIYDRAFSDDENDNDDRCCFAHVAPSAAERRVDPAADDLTRRRTSRVGPLVPAVHDAGI